MLQQLGKILEVIVLGCTSQEMSLKSMLVKFSAGTMMIERLGVFRRV